MRSIILLFLAFPGLHGRHPSSEDCNCPLPGSDGTISKLEIRESEYYYTPYDDDPYPQNGICTSSGYSFIDECWLTVYNKVYKQDVQVISDQPNFCNHTNCICDECDQFYYNPICVLDTETGDLTTVSNLCELNCMQCQKEVPIVHCGPCNVPCTKMEERLNCLGPPPPCVNVARSEQLPETNAEPEETGCFCPLIFAPLCTIDPTTEDFETFSNRCFLGCSENPALELLYNNGSGVCYCTTV